MVTVTDTSLGRRLWVSEARYYGVLVGVALMVPLSLGMLLMLLPPAQAVVDNWNVEGASGTVQLQVHGALTESACRLDMVSERQDVALGEIGTGRLLRVGAQGVPVQFELRLTDCLYRPASSRDVRTGGLTWANDQPSMTVSFEATRDADNPQLVKAQGVAGLGLRLTDGRGRDVRLGSRGAPLLLTPGQDTLIYTVTPERTLASLAAGRYRAVVGFHLSYD